MEVQKVKQLMNDEVNGERRKIHELTFIFSPLLRKIGKYRASVLSLPSARQPSEDIPAGAGCLCDKADVLRDTIKWTPGFYTRRHDVTSYKTLTLTNTADICRPVSCIDCDLVTVLISYNRSQWLRGLRRRPSAARMLRSWVRILLVSWMSVVIAVVLSGRGLCDGMITRPEESYRL